VQASSPKEGGRNASLPAESSPKDSRVLAPLRRATAIWTPEREDVRSEERRLLYASLYGRRVLSLQP